MKCLQITSGLITLLLATTTLAEPTINTDKLTPANPAIKKQLDTTMPESQKKALKYAAKPRARVLRSEVSWTFPASSDGWCRSDTTDQASLQVTMHYNWAQEPRTTTMPVRMVVKTPRGLEKSQNRLVYGGGGRAENMDISEHFRFNKAELCSISGPQLCVQIRYAPVVTADANRIDQVWKQVCSAW